MKIFFSTTTSQFDKFKHLYYMIRGFLVKEGHILTRDWLQLIRDREEGIEIPKLNAKERYHYVVSALTNTKILIIEDTVSSFSNGHLITLALVKKIPVLVLWHEKLKKKKFKTNFIEGIESDYLEIHKYNEKNYKDIIRGFIKKYTKTGEKNRFHLVLDGIEREYLDWAQYNYKKSRTEVIRGSIRKTIDKDEEYQRYLKN